MTYTKKIFSSLLVLTSILCFSQISFGLRGNLLYKANKPTLTDLQNTTTNIYQKKGEKLGYNIGVSAKIGKTFFIMPELYYTTFQSQFTDTLTNSTITIKSNRADLPVLLGFDFLENKASIFAGPVASYNLKTDNQWEDFKENASKEFTVGYQIGAQAKISNIIINARYEGAFSNEEKDFINSNTSETIRYDGRQSLLIVGLGFNF